MVTRLLVSAGVVWLLGLCVVTRGRAARWADERQLWADAVRHAPEKPRPWVNLGNLHASHGEWAAARESYRRALDLATAPSPRSPTERAAGAALASLNLLIVLEQTEHCQVIRASIGDLVQRYPSWPAVHETAQRLRQQGCG